MIDHSRKILFIHIARTGGTSIETALLGKDWWQIEPDTKHISASQARKHYGEEVWNTYHKFSVVRNPWDRLVSMWVTGWWNRGGLEGSKCFKQFLAGVTPHPNEKYDSLFYSEILNEHDIDIIKFENLQNNFSSYLESKSILNVRLPHVESRAHKHYLEYYDEESLDYVENKFSKDIAEFDYNRPYIKSN